jgi:hypothetical protein
MVIFNLKFELVLESNEIGSSVFKDLVNLNGEIYRDDQCT